MINPSFLSIFKKPYPRRMLIYCILAMVGIIGFAYTGGTWLEAFYIYMGFHFVPTLMTLGIHRWITHHHFEPYKPFRWLLLWVIVVAGVMTPIEFAWSHRIHHKVYDDDDKNTNDPISNSIGFWRLFFADFNVPKNTRVPLKDVIKHKDIMFVEKNFAVLRVLNFGLLWVIDPHIAMLSFLFSNVASMAHSAFVHGLLHNGIWADKHYPVDINPLWQFVTWETLHDQHHTYPNEPRFGKHNGKFDFGYHVMKLLGTVKETR